MVSRSLTVGAAVREVKPVRYVVRRFGALLVTCWVALTVNFACPGSCLATGRNHVLRYQGKVSPTAISAMELDFGLNTKTGELGQYFDYLGHTLTGNLGVSFSYFPSHVGTLIGQASLGLSG